MYEYEVSFRIPPTDTTHTAIVTLLEQCHSGNSQKLLSEAIERQFGKKPNNIYNYKFLGKK